MPFMVGFAGPSCSGKSSVCDRLLGYFPGAEHLSLDDFLKNRERYPMYGGFVNMDSPECIEFDELFEALTALRKSRTAEIPTYDMLLSRRTGTRIAQPSKIVFCDGFLLFYDPDVSSLFDMRFYLDLPVHAQKRRRLDRGVHADEEYFDKVVVPMFENYGMDAANQAHHVVNADQPLDIVAAEAARIISQGVNGNA